MLEEILNRRDAPAGVPAMTKEFFANVYAYMFLALGVSSFTAYIAGSSKVYWSYMLTETGLSPWFYVVAFSPLLLVFGIQAKYKQMSMSLLSVLFILFSGLMGLSLASVFLTYSLGTIFNVFLVSAGMFGGMAILGYTTKTDLAKFGSIMYMLFMGIFIASLVNFFMHSKAMGYWISFIGIFVFTGLTAWEMQNLKYIASDPSIDANDKKKIALIGGLSLYITFINLFLSMLRVFGGRE
jgi:FtsH-binding integral membrane protein